MRYDLHMHTHYSRCSNLKPDVLLKLAKKHKLDGIAITDHNEIKGALAVKKLNRDRNFDVVIGEEVSTNYGDILVYYLNKKIDKIDFYDVVDEARKQNALIAIAHPFRATLVNDHKFRLPLDKIKNKIDAVECFNARMMLPWNNKKANEAAERLGIAKTAGSDAHFFFEVGTAATVFEGNLREAIRRKIARVEGKIRFGAFGGALSYLRKRLP